MEESELTPNAAPEETIPEALPPKKKRRIGRVLGVILVVLLVLAAAAYAGFTYLRSSPQLKHISQNALVVARIDVPMLIKKADIIEIRKGTANNDLRETLEELNMEALIDDPGSTGIFTVKPHYYCLDYDAKDEELLNYLVLPIADGAKLAKFLKGITLPGDEELDVETKGNKKVLEIDGASCVWNNNTLVVAIDQDADPNAATNRAVKLLDQPAAKSIKANKVFKKAKLAKHDISLWVNTDMVAGVAEKGFKEARTRVKEIAAKRKEYNQKMNDYYAARQNYYQNLRSYMYSEDYYYRDYPDFNLQPPQMEYERAGNMFEEVLLSAETDSPFSADEIIATVAEFRGSSFLAYADFEKGSIRTGVDSNFSPAQVKKYGKIMARLGDMGKLAKYLPKDRLFASAVYQSDWNATWNVFGKQVNNMLIKRPYSEADKDELEKYTKHLKNLCDGSLLASMNLGAGKEKLPFVTIAGLARKNTGAQEMLKQLDKDGAYNKSGNAYKNQNGPDAFVLNEAVIVWTSDYSQYKKSAQGLGGKDLRGVKSSPLAAFVDLAQLVELADDSLEDMDLEDDWQDILEMLVDLRLTTTTKSGMPDVIEVELRLKDTRKNSLKVIWETLTDKVDIFEGMKENLEWQARRMKIEAEVPADSMMVEEAWEDMSNEPMYDSLGRYIY